MSVLTVFNGSFCKEEAVIGEVVKNTGYKMVSDNDVVAEGARISGMAENKIRSAFSAKTSVFNKFTHEKERALAWLRLATARILSQDNLLINGFSGMLIPKEIAHVLRVCLIADMKFRISAAENQGISEKEALNLIRRQDADKAEFIDTLFRLKDPWDASLFDIVIPADKMDEKEAVALIEKNLRNEVIMPTDSSKKAAQDFILSANVEVELAKEGHSAGVSSRDGSVTLTINKPVLMLHRLEEELKAIAVKVPGVKSLETRVGKGYHQADIYRKYDFEFPRLLLVDDEREFVQTLSERLLMRDMGSAVAYDGESALSLINEDEPDVMILDLKMPGIDGIEVLTQVKKTRPEIEVIILTGHGSEADKKKCMELGAFAYLHKPVDIDVLSEKLKEAKIKMKAGK